MIVGPQSCRMGSAVGPFEIRWLSPLLRQGQPGQTVQDCCQLGFEYLLHVSGHLPPVVGSSLSQGCFCLTQLYSFSFSSFTAFL